MAGIEVGPGTGALGGAEGGEGGEATLGARIAPAPFPSGANGGHCGWGVRGHSLARVVRGEFEVAKGEGVLKRPRYCTQA